MAKYKAYTEYKDSGVEWLGEMPCHWYLQKGKYIFRKVQRTTTDQDGIITAFRDGQVTLRSNRRVDGFTNALKEIGYQGVRVGDLLVHAMDGFAGAIGISDSDGKCSPVCSVCIPWDAKGIHMRYYGYLVRQLAVTDFILSLAKGIRERSTEFRFSEFSGLFLSVPPLSEQNQIARFLDHETAKIDKLIEKQQQLIELLKEKRQAVISHAVTKGLNPDVPMKDSGVEWLGKVPEHWSVLKGGYIGRLFGSEAVIESSISNYGRLPFIKVSTLSLESFSPNQTEWFIKSPHDKNYKAEKDYIVFPKRGAAIHTNKVNIVRERSVIDPNLMGWKMSNNVSEEYIAFALKKRGLSDIADVSTVPQINNKHIAPEKFPVPPYHEQLAIVDYLHTTLSILDELIDQTQKSIIFSQERRTALISAAVTGKIDVRDWVAPDTSDIGATEEATA